MAKKTGKKIENNFVTLPELKSELSVLRGELSTLETRITEKMATNRNEIMTGLDKIMGELEKAREDRVFAKAKDTEQDQRISGLEIRVKKVEARIGG